MKTFAIAGHLGATPALETKGKTTWTDLRVAVNGAKGHTDWFWITAFGPLAEAICSCLVKGSGVAVNGELRTEEWKGNYRTKFIAKQATFFGKGQAKTEAPVAEADQASLDQDDDDIAF